MECAIFEIGPILDYRWVLMGVMVYLVVARATIAGIESTSSRKWVVVVLKRESRQQWWR